MNNREEHIYNWIGRITLVFFFFFLVSVADNYSDQSTESALNSLVQVTSIEKSALPIDPVRVLNVPLFTLHNAHAIPGNKPLKENIYLTQAVSRNNYLAEKKRFREIRPRLIIINLPNIRSLPEDPYYC